MGIKSRNEGRERKRESRAGGRSKVAVLCIEEWRRRTVCREIMQ